MRREKKGRRLSLLDIVCLAQKQNKDFKKRKTWIVFLKTVTTATFRIDSWLFLRLLVFASYYNLV